LIERRRLNGQADTCRILRIRVYGTRKRRPYRNVLRNSITRSASAVPRDDSVEKFANRPETTRRAVRVVMAVVAADDNRRLAIGISETRRIRAVRLF